MVIAYRVPWRRLDPGQEWLCDVVVLQSEAQWAAQLRVSKDVVAQSMAVQVRGAQVLLVRYHHEL